MTKNTNKKVTSKNLYGFQQLKLQHMEESQPKLLKMLHSQGELARYLKDVADQCEELLDQKLKEGMRPEVIMEILRETWISLPDIEDDSIDTTNPYEDNL